MFSFLSFYPFSRGAYFLTYFLMKLILKSTLVILCIVLDAQIVFIDFFLVKAVRGQLLKLLCLSIQKLGKRTRKCACFSTGNPLE